jgi:hypothetical protein
MGVADKEDHIACQHFLLEIYITFFKRGGDTFFSFLNSNIFLFVARRFTLSEFFVL